MKAVIESPFTNENPVFYAENLIYINAVARKLSLETNISPLFFHSYYTQFLNDNSNKERQIGLESSFKFHDLISLQLVTIDRGISKGMKLGVERGLRKKIEPKFITLDKDNEKLLILIEDINQIQDPTERWQIGLNKIEKMTPKVINDFGDFTGYRNSNLTLMNQVKKNLTTFFSPLVDYIEQKNQCEPCQLSPMLKYL